MLIILIEVNYIAVLAAAIASMGVGFLWYSPLLVGNQWLAEMGLSKKDMEKGKKNANKMYMLSTLGALVMAYVLYHVVEMSVAFYGYSRLQTGLTSAFWMWLGFVMPVQMTEVLFGGKSMKLFAINTGYQLASLLAMGIIIGNM